MFLTVPDEDRLAALIDDIDCGDWRLRITKPDGTLYRYTAFHEPDLDGALTAIALEPDAHPLVRKLPLAFPPGAASRPDPNP